MVFNIHCTWESWYKAARKWNRKLLSTTCIYFLQSSIWLFADFPDSPLHPNPAIQDSDNRRPPLSLSTSPNHWPITLHRVLSPPSTLSPSQRNSLYSANCPNADPRCATPRPRFPPRSAVILPLPLQILPKSNNHLFLPLTQITIHTHHVFRSLKERIPLHPPGQARHAGQASRGSAVSLPPSPHDACCDSDGGTID